MVDGSGLENRHTRKGIGGSNPSLSAITLVISVRVSHKPDKGWTPKAYKEREIPIPTKLVNSLKAWKAKSDKSCSLVFPTAGCRPKLDFLDCLKAWQICSRGKPHVELSDLTSESTIFLRRP